jgi:tetratricopeptide (TPR) repeat protein
MAKSFQEWGILSGHSKEITAIVEKRLASIEGNEAKAAELGSLLDMLSGDAKGPASGLLAFRSLLEMTLVVDPENKAGLKLKHLGNNYEAAKRKRDEEARKKYGDMIRELDPENEHGHLEFAFVDDINALFKDKKFAEAAEKLVDFIVNKKPKKLGDLYYWGAGVAYIQSGNAEQGKEYFKKLVELYPDSQRTGQAKRYLQQHGG